MAAEEASGANGAKVARELGAVLHEVCLFSPVPSHLLLLAERLCRRATARRAGLGGTFARAPLDPSS
jgi:hypothetical protein